MPFPLCLALAYLRPRRSFASAIPVITVLGVTLGVAILMIVLAVMTGFGDVWREKILSFKPHIVVAARTPDGVVADPEAVCRAAEAVPGVASACPAIVFPAMIRSDEGGDPIAVTVVGIDPDRPSILRNAASNLVAGVFDPSGDRALVGRTLARRLWTGPGGRFLCYSPLNLRSADELYFPEELRISGVYDMKMAQFDDGMVVCSLGMARDLMGMDGGARLVQVQVAAPEFAHVQAQALAEALGPLYAVSTWQDEDAMLFNALRTEKMMMFILLAFIAVVAAFLLNQFAKLNPNFSYAGLTLIMSILFDTAIRLDELVQLKTGDIYDHNSCTYLLIHGKGNKERKVSLDEKTEQLLRCYMREYHAGSPVPETPLIYTKYKGNFKHMTHRNIQKILKKY